MSPRPSRAEVLRAPLRYIDPTTVVEVRQGELPPNPYASGYGAQIPTSWELRLRLEDPASGVTTTRWHRVYIVQYSNAGSAYVMARGGRIFLGGFEPRDFQANQRAAAAAANVPPGGQP